MLSFYLIISEELLCCYLCKSFDDLLYSVYSVSMKIELLKDVHASSVSQDPSSVLLETLLILTSDDSLWGTAVMDHLMRSKLFYLLRHILLQVVGPTIRTME